MVLGYNQGEPGGVISTDTGSNHLLPLEGKQMAERDDIGFLDPVLAAVNDPKKRESLRRRLDQKIKKGAPDECWPWTARATCNGGYGAINAGRGPTLRAHRVVWALAGGDLPAGEVLRHSCDNPPCCNPAHLILGTQLQNIADMAIRGRRVNPPVHRGERHHLALIPDATISLLRADCRSYPVLARLYGVSEKTIYRIKKGISR